MTGDLTPLSGARTAPTRCSDSAVTSPLRHSVPARPFGSGLHSVPARPCGPGLHSVRARPFGPGLHSVPARPFGPALHSAPKPPYGPGAPARQYDQVVLARRRSGQVLLVRPALPVGLAGHFFDFSPLAL
jgi:hypothetical protein